MDNIIELLDIAFRNPVSEDDYHDIVACMRNYGYKGKQLDEHEKTLIVAKGWPDHYNPFDHMENIRFGMCFQDNDNEIISNIKRLHSLLKHQQ